MSTELKVPYAIHNETRKIVAPADAKRGLDAGYYCPATNEPVSVVRGPIRIWHFRHAPGITLDAKQRQRLHSFHQGGRETYLHEFAKEVLHEMCHADEEHILALPKHKHIDRTYLDIFTDVSCAEVEQPIIVNSGIKRCDVLITLCNGTQLVVEIFNTNKKEKGYAEQIFESNSEYNLSSKLVTAIIELEVNERILETVYEGTLEDYMRLKRSTKKSIMISILSKYAKRRYLGHQAFGVDWQIIQEIDELREEHERAIKQAIKQDGQLQQQAVELRLAYQQIEELGQTCHKFRREKGEMSDKIKQLESKKTSLKMKAQKKITDLRLKIQEGNKKLAKYNAAAGTIAKLEEKNKKLSERNATLEKIAKGESPEDDLKRREAILKRKQEELVRKKENLDWRQSEEFADIMTGKDDSLAGKAIRRMQIEEWKQE